MSYVGDPNPPTPAFSSSHDWIKYYLVIHRLSRKFWHSTSALRSECQAHAVITTHSPAPSYRYAFYLWFFFALCYILHSLFRLAGTSYLGVAWHKWAIRRLSLKFPKRQAKNVRKKAMQYSVPGFNSPPPPVNVRLSNPLVNAQALALLLFLTVVFLACFLGPDYIKPSVNTFDLTHYKRSLSQLPNSISTIYSRDYTIVPVNPPQYTISKAWWTVGARTGSHILSLTL